MGTKPLKLSSDLADIVGKKEASRAECIKELCAYLKKHNLQTPDNKQFFLPDKKMAKVFGSDKIRAFSMSKHIGAHFKVYSAPVSPSAWLVVSALQEAGVVMFLSERTA